MINGLKTNEVNTTAFHSELFIQPIILLTQYVNSWIPGEYNA